MNYAPFKPPFRYVVGSTYPTKDLVVDADDNIVLELCASRFAITTLKSAQDAIKIQDSIGERVAELMNKDAKAITDTDRIEFLVKHAADFKFTVLRPGQHEHGNPFYATGVVIRAVIDSGINWWKRIKDAEETK